MADLEVFDVDAQAPETPVEAAPEPQEAAPEAAAEETPPPKPKDPLAKLTGRIGGLTRVLSEKDAALNQALADIETLRAMLPQADNGQPAPKQGQPIDLETRAGQIADQRLFDAECNKVFEAGVSEFGADFQQSVTNLNSMNLASRPLVEAAIEAGAPAAILKFLGEDLDEAERIARLPPAKMGVALARLAGTLTESNHSRAPQPIKPIGGGAKIEPDIYNPELSDDDYYEMRKKQGAYYSKA